MWIFVDMGSLTWSRLAFLQIVLTWNSLHDVVTIQYTGYSLGVRNKLWLMGSVCPNLAPRKLGHIRLHWPKCGPKSFSIIYLLGVANMTKWGSYVTMSSLLQQKRDKQLENRFKPLVVGTSTSNTSRKTSRTSSRPSCLVSTQKKKLKISEKAVSVKPGTRKEVSQQFRGSTVRATLPRVKQLRALKVSDTTSLCRSSPEIQELLQISACFHEKAWRSWW